MDLSHLKVLVTGGAGIGVGGGTCAALANYGATLVTSAWNPGRPEHPLPTNRASPLPGATNRGQTQIISLVSHKSTEYNKVMADPNEIAYQ